MNIPKLREQIHTKDNVTIKLSEYELELIQYLLNESLIENDALFDEFKEFIEIIVKVRKAQKGSN